MTIKKTVLFAWRSRTWRGGFFVVLLILTGIAVERHQASKVSPPDDRPWVSVQSEPLAHTVGLSGKIEPRRTLVVTAPFDGNVLINHVEPGQRVEQGQVLLTMEPALIEVQLREALAVQLKTRRTLHELQNWHDSPAVARARRTSRAAETSLENLNNKLRDSQKLLERGIIARYELEDLNQQVQMQNIELAAARSELQQVLDQGSGEYREIAEMELRNATVKLEGLQALLHSQNVIAPFTGVVVPVSANQRSAADSTAPIQAGAKLSQGQALFQLADIEQLKIVTSVSELDINQLKQGQVVEIRGDAFQPDRLSGLVEIVSRSAQSDGESSDSARFSVTVSIPKLTHEQLRRIRLGMSTNLTIITYRNDQAIIVPPESILREGDARIVEYREGTDQPIQRMPVTTGRSTLKGVEVFGLSPGLVRLQI